MYKLTTTMYVLDKAVVQFSICFGLAFMGAFEKIFSSPESVREACVESGSSLFMSEYARDEIADPKTLIRNGSSTSPEQILRSLAELRAQGETAFNRTLGRLRERVRIESKEFAREAFENMTESSMPDYFLNTCLRLTTIMFVDRFRGHFGYWPPIALCEYFLKAVMASFMSAGLMCDDGRNVLTEFPPFAGVRD